MKVRFSKQAKKDIQNIPLDVRKIIRNAIDGLKSEPPQGDIKTLNGYSDGRKRLRVGKYRVIFQYRNDGEVYILVIEIGTRGDIYK